MARDVVATLPRAADGLASGVGEDLARVAHLGLFPVGGGRVRVDYCALPAGESKTAVDEGRAEEPLRDGAPDGRD